MAQGERSTWAYHLIRSARIAAAVAFASIPASDPDANLGKRLEIWCGGAVTRTFIQMVGKAGDARVAPYALADVATPARRSRRRRTIMTGMTPRAHTRQNQGGMMERHTPESVYELLQHDHYTVEEVSQLLGIDINVIRHAIFTRKLPAEMAGEDIVSVKRADVVTWFRDQGNDV